MLTGVVEEKSNRVVELILSTVRPRHLLAGKVIGIGLLGLAQLALIAGLAAVLLAAGAFDAPAALGGSVALVIPWFALGFALYAVAYAAAGALASGQQDANSAGSPSPTRSSPSTSSATSRSPPTSNGLLANLLTVFPLTAPLVLPARSALVGVPTLGARARRRPRPRHRSTRSSASPAASTRTASSAAARASASAPPGASPASADAMIASAMGQLLAERRGGRKALTNPKGGIR